MSYDRAAAQAFLQNWYGSDTPISLGAIDAYTDGTRHEWLTTLDLDVAMTFIDANQARGWNCYFQPNVCREDAMGQRISAQDVVLATCVHAEVDPPEDVSTPEQLDQWQQDSGNRFVDPAYWLNVGVPAPTEVIFSGSGWVLLWRLREWYPLWVERDGEWQPDPEAAGNVERRNRWLVQAIGADPASTDVSRLLRLPGTTNFPSASKGKKGRTGPVDAELVSTSDARIELDAVPMVAPRAQSTTVRELPEFPGRPSQDQWDAAVAAMSEAWPPFGSRHLTRRALTGALAHAGWPEDAIVDFVVQMPTDNPENTEVSVRDFAARAVRMIADGEAVEGWPVLESRLVGDAAGAIRATRTALGMPTLVLDPAGADRWREIAERSRPQTPPPTQLEDEAAIDAAINRLSRSRDPDARADAERLRRAQRGAFLVDDPSEDQNVALVRAAMAVGRALPPGPDFGARISRQLVASAGPLAPDLNEISALVVETLDEERRQTAATEFAVETAGPRMGRPIPNDQGNFDIACANMGLTLRYDRFARQKLIRVGPDAREEVLQDEHVTQLRLRIDREFEFKPDIRELRELITDRALQNSFHPVLDYFEGLPDHDGQPRIGGGDQISWLTTYLGVPDSEYVRAIGRIVLVALVRRIRRPGCKFDEMLILEGGQGVSKSSAIEVLCPRQEWFSDDFDLTWDSQKLIEQTRGKWIVEVPELQGKTQADQNRLKAQLTRKVDRSRKAYGHEPEEVARQFCMIATVNEGQYFTDLTGNRRYWPVKMGFIDLPALARDRDQLWAEACMLDLQHPEKEYIRLDPSLYEAAAQEQARRQVDNPQVIVLQEYLGDLTGRISVRDVWRLLGFHEERTPSKGETAGISQALQSMGWQKCEGPGRVTWYGRGTADEQQVSLRVAGTLQQGLKVEVVPAPQPVAAKPQSVLGLN